MRTVPPLALLVLLLACGGDAINSRSLRGGSAVLLRIGAGAPGATQLLDVRSSTTAPLPASSPVGLAVLRIQ